MGRVTRRGPKPDPAADAKVFEERLAAERGEGPPVEPEPWSVSLGEGRFAPTRFAWSHDDEARGLRISLEVAVVDGQPTCEQLTVAGLDGRPVQRQDLRAIPLGEYLDRALAEVAYTPERGVVYTRFPSHEPGTGEVLRRRRLGVTDERLREVARVYRAAHAAGLPPTVTVAKEMHVSRSTAGRLIQQARARGALGPAVPRKPGEAQQPEGS